jgi:hypothetical protein
VIANCDASAEAAVHAEASAASLAAKFAAGCAAVGGTLGLNALFGPQCDVSYPGYPDHQVPLNANGTLDQEQASINQQNCATDLQDAELDAQEGSRWSVLPVYYPKTGVCTTGSS